jgi:hypothetical protein
MLADTSYVYTSLGKKYCNFFSVGFSDRKTIRLQHMSANAYMGEFLVLLINVKAGFEWRLYLLDYHTEKSTALHMRIFMSIDTQFKHDQT